MMKSIDVFVGGSTDMDISESYHNTAIELGQRINERKDYNIIFDGCFGLPFLTFSELDDTSRSVVFQTRYYCNDYVYSTDALLCSFNSQSEFIGAIPNRSDAMIFMKGGASTIAEIMHCVESKKNGEHDKPIVILNVNDEFSDFVNLLNSLNADDIYYVTDDVLDGLNYIENELFSDKSSFRSRFVQFMERRKPIIVEKTKTNNK